MADPSRFSDPFWSVDSPSLSEAKAVAQATGSVGKVYTMSSFQSFGDSSEGMDVDGSESLESMPARTNFKIPGLGLIAVKCAPRKELEFVVYAGNQPTLRLSIRQSSLAMYRWDKSKGSEVKVDPVSPKGMSSAFLNDTTKDETVYWISVDRSNSRFRYGQHLLNASMTYLENTFEDNETDRWMNDLTATEVKIDGKVNVPKQEFKQGQELKHDKGCPQ